MLSRAGLVQQTYAAGLPRMAAGVALVWQFAILIQVLAYRDDFRQPAVPVLVWLGLLGAAAWLLPRARGSRLSRPDAALAIAVAVAAVAVVGWERRLTATGAAARPVAAAGGLLALVALSRPAWEWITGALLVFAAHALVAYRVLGVTALGQARLAATGYTLLVILAGFAALSPAIRVQARVAARRATLASQTAAERAATAAIQQDRQRRLDVLEADVLPLLRGIADGSLDPADPAVQQRSGQHAAALRRALADRAEPDGGLLAGLAPALSAAEDRGLPVQVQVIGDPGIPAPEVAGATRAAVSDVVGALPPHPVVLTVLASEDEVELYLTFERPPPSPVDVAGLRRLVPATAGWQATVDIGDAGGGFLAVRWRKAA